MNFTTDEAAERALARLLDALATLLMPLDVTPSRLAQIARTAFVRAEARNAKVRSSGRPHIARIAARTGLSRIEVKRIVEADFSYKKLDPEHLPRALRVLYAWKTSSDFTANGRPRSLQICGKFASFEALCRRYSGDIPHKVILRELETRKLIRVNPKKASVSVARPYGHDVGRLREVNALVFAASIVDELVSKENILVKRKEYISASDKIPISYVETAIADRVTELLDNLPQLFVPKRRPRKGKRGVSIFALVSRSPKMGQIEG